MSDNIHNSYRQNWQNIYHKPSYCWESRSHRIVWKSHNAQRYTDRQTDKW